MGAPASLFRTAAVSTFAQPPSASLPFASVSAPSLQRAGNLTKKVLRDATKKKKIKTTVLGAQ